MREECNGMAHTKDLVGSVTVLYDVAVEDGFEGHRLGIWNGVVGYKARAKRVCVVYTKTWLLA